MSSTTLCTLSELKSHLGIAGDTYDDALERLADAAADVIESHCRRRFAQAAYTEYHDVRGHNEIVLLERPVTAVADVWDDPDREFEEDARLDSSEYVADTVAGMVRLKAGRFFDGKRNVKIIYTAGYVSVPEDISLAGLLLAAEWFRQGRELPAGPAPTRGPLPQQVLRLLAPYKEPVL